MSLAKPLTNPEDGVSYNPFAAVWKRVYGEQLPVFYASSIERQLAGREPLSGVCVYEGEREVPYWHFITVGFSDPHRKLALEPGQSGCGFELTLRLRRAENEAEPPGWVFHFLQNLARYVFATGNLFDEGHYLDLNGPLPVCDKARLSAIALTHDPEISEVYTSNGRVRFLEVFGLTDDEFSAVRGWDTLGFFDLIRTVNPLLITEPDRSSYLRVPAIRAKVDDGRLREGSSTDFLFVASARWSLREGHGPSVTLYLGANGIRELCEFLPGRVPLGRYLAIVSGNHVIRFEPAARSSWGETGNTLIIRLTPKGAIALAESLRPKAGIYDVPEMPEVKIIIERSDIRDEYGRVVETIG